MSVPLSNLTDTWNNSGTVFSAVSMNVTNTASDPASKLIDLRVGGSSLFKITAAGDISTFGKILGANIDLSAQYNFYGGTTTTMAIQGVVGNNGTLLSLSNSAVTGLLNITNASCNSTGDLIHYLQQNGVGSAGVSIYTYNASPGANSGCFVRTGDSGQSWVAGIHPNDSHSYKINCYTDFSANNYFKIGTDGAVDISGSLHVGKYLAVGGAGNADTLGAFSVSIYDATASKYGVSTGIGFTLTANNSQIIIGNSCYVSFGVGAFVQSGSIMGANYTVYTGPAGSTTYTAIGCYGFIYDSGGGHLLTGHAFEAAVANTQAGGVIDTYVGYYAGGNNSGTITNYYGVYVDDITNSPTNQWGIFVKSMSSSFGGRVKFAAATISNSSINIAAGVASTSPADGDFWYDGTNVKFRVGGTTKTFTLT
jgi:hypothetical protein